MNGQGARRRRSALAVHVLAALLLIGLIVGTPFAVRYGQSDLGSAIAGGFLTVCTLAVGWLLAWKLPRNPIGWLLVVAVAFFALGPLAFLAGRAIGPVAPLVAEWLYWFSGDTADSWSWVPPIWLLLVAIPLRFPTGALPSPRWRWFWWVCVGWAVLASVAFATAMGPLYGLPNPTLIPFVSAEFGQVAIPLIVLAFGCFGGTVASLVVRYVHGDAVVRAQLKWAVLGVAIAAGLLVLTWFLPSGSDWADSLVLAAFGLVPVAIGVAVLRYRLYEIDRIISRTAAWAIVTLAVVAVYAGIVLLAGLLLPDLPAVGVALATLAAAGVFLPVLRRTRGGVDRVFNREQYDAERVVDAFGQRLRDGADPFVTRSALTAAVDRTLRPQLIAFWTPGGRS